MPSDAYCVVAVADAETEIDAPGVRLDGVEREVQLRGDLPFCQVRRKEL